MNKRVKDSVDRYVLSLPVRVEVRSLEDGSHISCTETTLEHIVVADVVRELEEEIKTGEREFHEIEKYKISAHVRRDLIPKESDDSPVFLPNTWIEVIIDGDIRTWGRKPYKENPPAKSKLVN